MNWYLIIAILGTIGTVCFTYSDYKDHKASKKHLTKIATINGVVLILELILLFSE